MKSNDILDIDWKNLNTMLDNMEYSVIFPGDQDKQLNKPMSAVDRAGGNYNPDNCRRHEYISDKLYDLLPTSFLKKNNFGKDVIIKILEHPPGTFTFPHKDTYDYIKTKLSLDKESKIKRLWIPCTDYKFGHALFIGNDVIANYKAGDVFEIEGSILHSGANAGVEKRRIMTITGRVYN